MQKSMWPILLLFGQWVPAGLQAFANEQFKSHRWKDARPNSLLSIQVDPSESHREDEIVMHHF